MANCSFGSDETPKILDISAFSFGARIILINKVWHGHDMIKFWGQIVHNLTYLSSCHSFAKKKKKKKLYSHSLTEVPDQSNLQWIVHVTLAAQFVLVIRAAQTKEPT